MARPPVGMNSDVTSRTLITLAGLAVVAGCLYLVREILPPFLIAFGLALLLDPVVERLQRRGVPRWGAVAITFAVLMGAFLGLIAIVVPLVVTQIAELVHNLPRYGVHLQEIIDRWGHKHAALLKKLNLPPTLADLWRQYQQDITAYLQVILQRLFESLQSSVPVLGWLLVIPIVTLYLMFDLEALRARLFHLVAEQHRDTVIRITTQVGHVFSAYLRGLTMLCLAFGSTVYVVLALGFQLPYSAILAVGAAVLYSVPYLGQFALLAVCTLVAWATGHTVAYIIALPIALILVGQVFDQLVTPRVIGKQVGLHPVLGLFALFAGGQIFGLVGMVVAVPVAASVRVVLIQLYPRLSEPIGPEEATAEAESAILPTSPSAPRIEGLVAAGDGEAE